MSNTTAKLYGTAKIDKFEDILNIAVNSLKFQSFNTQTGSCMYNVTQVFPNNLSLCTQTTTYYNKYQQLSIVNSESITKSIRWDEEYVSYDVESLFTNVPVNDTITYIMDKIYKNEKWPKICIRLIMKRFLEKLTQCKVPSSFNQDIINRLMTAQWVNYYPSPCQHILDKTWE